MWRRSQRRKPEKVDVTRSSPPRDGSWLPQLSKHPWSFRKFGRNHRIPRDIRAYENAPVRRTGSGELDAFFSDLFAELRRLDADVDGLALITNDGSPLASFLPEDLEDWVAAEAVWSALKYAWDSTAVFDRGDPVQIVLSADAGYIIIHVIGNYAAIALTCGPKAKLGMILHGLQETAAVIGPVVKTYMEKPFRTPTEHQPEPETDNEAGDGGIEADGSGVTVEVFEV
jgi:predicted regulator of Ras-like GTPase activity (Roadblock/LC7/MglB family)